MNTYENLILGPREPREPREARSATRLATRRATVSGGMESRADFFDDPGDPPDLSALPPLATAHEVPELKQFHNRHGALAGCVASPFSAC